MRISLADGQRRQIAAAAATLRHAARGAFIADVECAIEARCHGRAVTNADVTAAIEATLGVVPFWPRPVFMCDASNTQQEAAMTRQQQLDLDDIKDAEIFKDHSGRGLLYRRKVPYRPIFINPARCPLQSESDRIVARQRNDAMCH
jgi:hypothetical protein